MRSNRLDDLVADPIERVQARHRILEDHCHLVAAKRLDVVVRHGNQLLPIEPDLAGDLGGLAVDEPHDGLRGDALARSGLTDDRQGLALLQREGDAINGADEAVLGGERHSEIVDGQELPIERRFPPHDL